MQQRFNTTERSENLSAERIELTRRLRPEPHFLDQ